MMGGNGDQTRRERVGWLLSDGVERTPAMQEPTLPRGPFGDLTVEEIRAGLELLMMDGQ